MSQPVCGWVQSVYGYIIKNRMSGGEQQLGEWLGSMGLVGQLGKQQLQSGKTVALLLRALDRSSKIQLQEGNSAITRVTNWNALSEQLKKLGVKLTQDEKGKIINGNHDLVFRTISRLRELHHRSSKETEINLKEVDPKKELKDADSLLELFLLAIIKNFALSPKEALSLLSNDSKYLAHILAKGLKNDFRPIDNFIADLHRQLPKITLFSKNKENEIFFLRSIKPALISKAESVGDATLQLLKNYLETYQKEERVGLLREHLLGTLVLMVRRHPQLVDKIVQTMVQLGEYREDLLSEFVQNSPSSDLNSILISMWRVYRTDRKEQTLLKSPLFQKLLTHCNNCLQQPEQCLSSLDAMIELATHDFDLFSKRCGDALMSNFPSLSFSKDNEQTVFVHAVSALLRFAGEAKHPLAPMLFKYLTSRLATASEKEYDTLIYNLTHSITEIPTIPTLPVLESLSQRPDLKITQLEIIIFKKILAEGTQAKSGVAIYNMASRALVEDEGLGFQLGNMLVQLVSLFKQQEIIIDMSAKLIKVCLAIHFANIKKLTEKRKPISYKNKLDADEATAKLKKLQMENFLRKVIQLNNKDINTAVEPLLCFSLLQIETVSKEHARGLEKIVSLLGNVKELTNKYELELNEGEQSLKQSKMKQNSSNRYESEDHTEQSNNLIKSARRVVSSHPVSLTAVSVKADAFLGLQKYSKMHQTRFLAQQAKKEVQTQKQQDRKKLKKLYQRKLMVEKGLNMKSVAENELQYLFEFDSKQLYAEKNNLSINYYSNDCEEERDAHGLDNLMKRYEKTLRVYFTHYCGKKHGMTTKFFDEISERHTLLHTSNIFKMVNEHGLSNYITMSEIKMLARKVNYKLAKDREDPEMLDFDAFKEFVTQMCYTMFTRPPKDLSGHPVAEMMGELFSALKLYAAENRISPQLFEQPESCFPNEEEAVKVLNRKLQDNPDYILPQGYKKITETRVTYDHKIYLQAMSPTYKQVYEVLDEMLFDAFKFHIIQPFTRQERICKARPNIYFLERNKLAETVEVKHIPVFLKKEVAKFPIKDRVTAKEAASVLADIESAIELNHDQIGLKHENPIIRSKMEREEEERRHRDNENNKRVNFDRQLKTSMADYKEKREEIKEKEEQAKREELERKKEEKEKREKREKELKQKLEEYSQKKKEEQELKKSEELAKTQKEKDEAQRKKKDLQQTRKKIEQLKKQRQLQQKQRKQKQQEQQKRKKEEEKRKFQKAQKEKKQKIEQYKQKKKGSGVQHSKVMDSEDT